jgi:hypothetical protein
LKSDLKTIEDVIEKSHFFPLEPKQAIRELAIEPFGENKIGENGSQYGRNENKHELPSLKNQEKGGHQKKGADEVT